MTHMAWMILPPPGLFKHSGYASAGIASLGTTTTGKDIELVDGITETDGLTRVVVM